MMKYDFDKQIDRSGTDSVKVDLTKQFFEKEDIIPMWVADMDFETPDFVREAVIDRARHPVYGYTFRSERFTDSIRGWMERRHGWKIEADHIIFSPGIVPALNMALMACTQMGDGVIVQPPVYFPFFSAVKETGRQLLENPLVKDKNGRYQINWDELKQLARKARAMLFCSPHNPVGRVWTRQELEYLAEICLENNLTLISDEIHADLVYKPHQHIPVASLNEEIGKLSLSMYAASKTFNLAGMATSWLVTESEPHKKAFQNILEKRIHVNMGNLFGYEATLAALNKGDGWLEQLLEYLAGNVEYVAERIKSRLNKIRLASPEATYLLWLDFTEYGLNDEDLYELVVQKAGLGLNNGPMFGTGGSGHQRMNIACPRKQVEMALNQLEKALHTI